MSNGQASRWSNSDYIQLYDCKKETLMNSLERFRSTATEILGAVIAEQEATDKEPCVAVAA